MSREGRQCLLIHPFTLLQTLIYHTLPINVKTTKEMNKKVCAIANNSVLVFVVFFLGIVGKCFALYFILWSRGFLGLKYDDLIMGED